MTSFCCVDCSLGTNFAHCSRFSIINFEQVKVSWDNRSLLLVDKISSFISSVIRQKGESQNECFKKAKHAKISEKQTLLTPLIRTRTCAHQEVRNVCFSEILACFLETLVLRFALLPYFRRFQLLIQLMIQKNGRKM